MEENKKKEASTAIIMVTIVLVAIVSSILSIVIYRQMLNNSGEKHLVSSLQEDLEKVQSENTMNSTNNENNGSNSNENHNNVIENSIIVQPIRLNNKDINVRVESSFVEWKYELEALFKQKMDITIDEKNVDSIETISWTQMGTINYQIPEIRLISDAENVESEYLMIVVDSFTPSAGRTKIYFYDDEGNKIDEIEDWGSTGVVLQENNTEIPSYEIFSDSVRIIEPLEGGGARMHEYTIVDGKMNDEIIEEYEADEVEQTGAVA